MASRPDSVLPLVGPRDKQRAARRIAILIVWAWLAAACGLGICTVILLSLSAPWLSAVSLLLGIGALLRALSLRRKISAARLGSLRPMPGMPPDLATPLIDPEPHSPLLADPPPPALVGLSAASSLLAATAASRQGPSLPVGSDPGERPDAHYFMGRSPAGDRFSERELTDLGLDRWEADAYRSSADEGGPGIGLWIGVGMVVLISVVVVRRRSVKAKRAAVAPDAATGDALSLSSARDMSKIPHSPLVEGTTSVPAGTQGSASPASAFRPDVAAPPITVSVASPPTRRPGRFTPPPTLARFAVIPLLISFALAYLAIRTAGDNTMSAAVPLGLVSFVALGVAFYLSPAS